MEYRVNLTNGEYYHFKKAYAEPAKKAVEQAIWGVAALTGDIQLYDNFVVQINPKHIVSIDTIN